MSTRINLHDNDGAQPVAVLLAPWEEMSVGRLSTGLVRMVGNLRMQLRILGLMRWDVFRRQLRRQPRFFFKFLTSRYLAGGMTVSERANCFLHHWQRLHEAFKTTALEQILAAELSLLMWERAEGSIEVRAGLRKVFDREGELTLTLHASGVPVYALSLTVVPGAELGRETLFVTHMQGVSAHYEQMQRVTRQLDKLGANRLLLGVTEALGAVLGVERLAIVTARRQSGYEARYGEVFERAYDRFASELGSERVAGVHELALPIPDKERDGSQQGNRARRKRQRALLEQIRAEVEANLRRMLR